MTVPHNQIVLKLPDGRKVSIIQNGYGSNGPAYGYAMSGTCEAWVDGEEAPRGFLTLSDLLEYIKEVS